MLRTCSVVPFFRKNPSHAQAWCKFCRDQFPKVLRHRQFLTILTSESLSRAGVVQILPRSTSKSAPGLPVFNDFDFQIALARRRGANFVGILGNPSQLPFFGPTFARLRSDKTMEKHSISRNSYPPKHLCCENIDAARATGTFQYSRKLELLNFLWLYYLLVPIKIL